jgi:GT2 family glycosyltransferase
MSFGRWCVELDLGADERVRSTLPWSGQELARVLVRLHREPVGYVVAPCPHGTVDPATVHALAASLLADRIADHLAEEGLTEASAPPTDRCRNKRVVDRFVTVAVATRDRPEIITRCLAHLSDLDYPDLEILVVDNAPKDARTQNAVLALAEKDPRIRYLREDRPGVSYARNRALEEARGSVICYTDDDVAVDRGWVDGLLRGFRMAPDVGCVTGLVCTADIATDIEAYCDARLPLWSSRCEPEVFVLDQPGADPLYPFSVGVFGTGASFAFDVELLREIGGFDPVLGAGTITRGGEDLDLFLRVLYAGRPLVYMPAAVVWHSHRATHAGLMKQMFGYGSGLTALMTKVFLDKRTRGDLLQRIPRGLRKVATNSKGTTERYAGPQAPKGAQRRELTGLLAGPYLYARSRRQHR